MYAIYDYKWLIPITKLVSYHSSPEDSGYPVSPSHSILRVHTTKHPPHTTSQNTPATLAHSLNTGVNGYDRPPLLMTFRTGSPDNHSGLDKADGNLGNKPNGVYHPYASFPRRDLPYSPNSHTAPARHGANSNSGRSAVLLDDRTAPVHKIHTSPRPVESGHRETIRKKLFDDDDPPYSRHGGSHGVNQSQHQNPVTFSRLKDKIRYSPPNGVKQLLHSPGGGGRQAQMCSEPPISRNENGDITSAIYTHNQNGVQETEPSSSNGSFTPRRTMANPMFVGDPRRADVKTFNLRNRKDHIKPNGVSIFVDHDAKASISSCPQLYTDVKNTQDVVQQRPTAMSASRSRSFTDHAPLPVGVARVSLLELDDSLDTQDDGNTTTTSGSYTIDTEDLSGDLPQTDIFVWHWWPFWILTTDFFKLPITVFFT